MNTDIRSSSLSWNICASILVVLFSFVHSSTDSSVCSANVDGFFADKVDANKFYRCVSGRSHPFNCEYSSIFDEALNRCRHKNAADRLKAKSAPSFAFPSSGFKCTENGFFADENDCQKYRHCFNNGFGFTLLYRTCEPGEGFNPNARRCEGNPNCVPGGAGFQTESTAAAVSTNAVTQTTVEPVTEVSKTEVVTKSTTVEVVTESTTAEVVSATVAMLTTTTTATSEAAPDTCTTIGYFRSSTDCSKFYRCVNLYGGSFFTKYEYSCPASLVFDERYSVCNWPHASPPCTATATTIKTTATINTPTTLSSTSTSTASSTSPPIASSTSPSTTSNTSPPSPTTTATNNEFPCPSQGFYRNPKDCRKFYRCVETLFSNYEVYHFACPANLVFDEQLETCNWPKLTAPCDSGPTNPTPTTTEITSGETGITDPTVVTTEETMTTTEETMTTTEETKVTVPGASENASLPDGIVCDNSDQFRRYPLQCESFYQCKKGDGKVSLTIFSCSKPFIFDEQSQSCKNEDETTECIKVASCSNDTATTMAPDMVTTDGGEEITTETSTDMGGEVTEIEVTTETTDGEVTTEETTDGEVTTEGTTDGEVTTEATTDGEVTTEATTDGEVTTETTTDVTDDGGEQTTMGTTDEVTTNGVEESTTEMEMETTTDSVSETTDGEMEVTTESSATNETEVVTVGSLYDCSSTGHFPFEEDCVRFYRCVKTEDDQLQGLLYVCPKSYIFDPSLLNVGFCRRKQEDDVCDKVLSGRTDPSILQSAILATAEFLYD